MKRPVTLWTSLVVPFAPSRTTANVVWNLSSGVWLGALVILATPIFVSRLGLEGYGVVGLWVVMQVMLGLLDAGMGATVIREFAGSGTSQAGQTVRRDLVRTLEVFYWAVALCCGVILAFAAGWVSESWFKPTALPVADVRSALQLMALALGLQFPASLYASGLAGLQQHGRLNMLNIVGNGLRYGGGVAVLLWRADVVWFFAAQALVASIQTLATRLILLRSLAQTGATAGFFRPELVGRVWRYSTGMALTSVVAVLMANSDRIAVSKMLPVAELGKYSLAFTATGLLQLAIQPFYRTFFPRYAQLVADGDTARLRQEYFDSCRLMAALIIPLGAIGWAFAPQLFFVWLGNVEPTVVTVFRFLLIGIACAGLVWLPAAFQQAHGWTKLHVGMMAAALIVGVPAMVWAIQVFGAVGATVIWLLHGLLGLSIELWLMHKRLLVGELLNWYRSVLLLQVAVTMPLVGLSRWMMPESLGRWDFLWWIAATGLLAIASILVPQHARNRRSLRMSIDEQSID